MSAAYRTIASDFYINQKLSLKLDLPRERQIILDLFDRLRKTFPAMTQVRRLKDEIALESQADADHHRWLAIRGPTVRSGAVNCDELEAAYAFQRQVLELTPYFLSISALDVDYLELLYGFDLLTSRNHDELVLEALMRGTPLGEALDVPGITVVDCRPMVGVTLTNGLGDAPELAGTSNRDVEISIEVKTRPGPRAAGREEPLSVYLTLRHYGPVADVKQLPAVLSRLGALAEELVEKRVLPGVVMPLREAIGPIG